MCFLLYKKCDICRYPDISTISVSECATFANERSDQNDQIVLPAVVARLDDDNPRWVLLGEHTIASRTDTSWEIFPERLCVRWAAELKISHCDGCQDVLIEQQRPASPGQWSSEVEYEQHRRADEDEQAERALDDMLAQTHSEILRLTEVNERQAEDGSEAAEQALDDMLTRAPGEIVRLTRENNRHHRQAEEDAEAAERGLDHMLALPPPGEIVRLTGENDRLPRGSEYHFLGP